ncbi:MAG: tetratricopeptide repeat protein [Planctomycetes bacterium]|nr:tetratricopeptide repeat protein [Planctomycetota bacterium]
MGLYLFQSLARRRARNRAAAFEKAGRFREARDAYRALGTGEAFLRAGALSTRIGELGLARQLLDQAVKLMPESADAYFHLASACLELRDTARADELFHEALKRAPDRVDILHAQAVYYAQKMPKAGLEAAKRAIARMLEQCADPARRVAFQGLGFPRELPLIFIRNLALEQQLVEEAAATFRELAGADREMWVRVAALNHLGLLLANAGQYQEAMLCYREALALDPTLHEAHFNLAMAHMRLHDFDAARAELSIFSKIHPRSPVTTFGMALIAETRGELPETIRLYKFFLDRQTKEPPVPAPMLGRLDVARTWVEHARRFLQSAG